MTQMVVKMLFGSHLYGLNNADSDTDYKGIILPTSQQILLQQADFSISESTGDDKSKNSAEDTDTEMYSIMRFIKLAAKGETVALDMLHAPEDMILETSEVWKHLVATRSRFYTKNMKAYIGYVRKQAAKYGVKGSRLAVIEEALEIARVEYRKDYGLKVRDILSILPMTEYSEIIKVSPSGSGDQTFYEICGRKFQDTLGLMTFIDALRKVYNSYGDRAKAAKENKGIDWKALSHALRAGYQAQAIYREGGFSYPLPQSVFLKNVKEGKLDYLTEVQPILDDLVDNVMLLSKVSSYPDEVNRDAINEMIIEVHNKIIAEQNLKDFLEN